MERSVSNLECKRMGWNRRYYGVTQLWVDTPVDMCDQVCICHAMRERRFCLWTASRSSPFRLDFEEAYFNISRSPEMLVPLSGGIALQYRSRASPGCKRVS